jgi:integrase
MVKAMGNKVRRTVENQRSTQDRNRMGKLTALKVARADIGMHADGDGLYLAVTSARARSWIYRYQVNGQKARDLGLGPAKDISLRRARELAAEARALKAEGIDPIEHRREQRKTEQLEAVKAITFKECCEQYIDLNGVAWRNPKHRQQWRNTLATYAYRTIGHLPVQAVDTGLVSKVLEPIWSTKPETASRVRGRIETILDWAKVKGYRAGENPAAWRGHLDKIFPAKTKVRKVKHHTALPYAEIPSFMAALRQRGGTAARALEFLILTAVRTGDVIGGEGDDALPMLWQHVDFNQKLWTIPRTKTGDEHRVPLSDAAFALLRERHAHYSHQPHVFASPLGQPLSCAAMDAVLKRMGFKGCATVHGFRSTFRDWAAERTNYQNHVVEIALAHTIESKVEAAYRRGDLFNKRRDLMRAWGAYCSKTPTIATVVPIGERV